MAKKPILWPIYFTVFLDLLGLGIIIPVFAPLFLDPSATLLPAATPLHHRTILLGLLIAAYPLTQFFSAPVLGALSDRLGRKPVLVVSIIGTALGYLVFAAGVVWGLLPLLFLGRVIDGFTGGNVSTALSAVADASDDHQKPHRFGVLAAMVALGLVFGPFLGGKLADSSLVSWFNFATPFWFAAIVATLNALVVGLFFRETIQRKTETRISLLMGIDNVGKAFRFPDLRVVFAVIFLFNLGFNFFAQFFQVFLVQKFHFTEARIGDLFAYAALWLILSQGFLTRPIGKRWRHHQVVAVTSVLLAASLALLLVPEKPAYLYLILPFVAVLTGLVQPNVTALISDLGHQDSQGEILGINQSMQSLAQAIPPLIAGVIASIHPNLPITVASLATLAGWYVFIRFFHPPNGRH